MVKKKRNEATIRLNSEGVKRRQPVTEGSRWLLAAIPRYPWNRISCSHPRRVCMPARSNHWRHNAECNGAARPDERPTNFNLSRNDFEHVAHFQADSNDARGNERGEQPVAPGEGREEGSSSSSFFVRAKIRFICVTARCVIRARLKVTQVLFPASSSSYLLRQIARIDNTYPLHGSKQTLEERSTEACNTRLYRASSSSWASRSSVFSLPRMGGHRFWQLPM